MDTLEHEIRAFLEETAQFYPDDTVQLSIEEQRACYNALCAHYRKPRPKSVSAKDFLVGEVPVRAYAPEGAHPDNLVIYLHGGGFVLGGLESHDDVCAEIAAHNNVRTLAVEYRLAPEHPFPAPFDDCVEVLQWATARAKQIVLAGDSAGGCLAAALTLYGREKEMDSIRGQVHIYPAFGLEPSGGSYVTNATAPGLTTQDVIFYLETYLGPRGNANWSNTFARPVLETSFAALPPAFLVAAEHDPVLDDATEYARKLDEAGVDVTLRVETGLVHGFLRARHSSKRAAGSFLAVCDAVGDFFK